jgi:hypothetical protein
MVVSKSVKRVDDYISINDIKEMEDDELVLVDRKFIFCVYTRYLIRSHADKTECDILVKLHNIIVILYKDEKIKKIPISAKDILFLFSNIENIPDKAFSKYEQE